MGATTAVLTTAALAVGWAAVRDRAWQEPNGPLPRPTLYRAGCVRTRNNTYSSATDTQLWTPHNWRAQLYVANFAGKTYARLGDMSGASIEGWKPTSADRQTHVPDAEGHIRSLYL